jgi:hypothetical protein
MAPANPPPESTFRNIVLTDYWAGRDLEYAEYWKPEYELNAKELLTRVNGLLRALDRPGAVVRSGWRPPPINDKVGGAPGSGHLTGRAIDLADSNRQLARIILRDYSVLEAAGLFMEDPGETRGWIHLQLHPPKSGNRIFKP